MDEIAEREAAGESLWTEDIDQRALVRIAEMWSRLQRASGQSWDTFGDRVASLLTIEGGWSVGTQLLPESLSRLDNRDLVLDTLQCVYSIVRDFSKEDVFSNFVNEVFNEFRVAFRLVDGDIVSFSSDELHVDVVEPVLRLLVDERFADAHESYLKALKEISHNDAADAITDAGTALQSVLTVLGCTGKSLGPLIKDAKKNGLLAGHDENLADGIIKFMAWASADRSETGDGHKVTDASLSDAWLMVHIVGALILRLADAVPRATSA